MERQREPVVRDGQAEVNGCFCRLQGQFGAAGRDKRDQRPEAIDWTVAEASVRGRARKDLELVLKSYGDQL